MTVSIQRQADAFLRTAEEVRQSRTPNRRRSLIRLLVKRADALKEERDRLYARIDSGFDHIQHDDVAPWESQWHQDESDYRLVCDALESGTSAFAENDRAAL